MIRPISNFTTINSKTKSCNYTTNSKHLTQATEMDTISFSARSFSEKQIKASGKVLGSLSDFLETSQFDPQFFVLSLFSKKYREPALYTKALKEIGGILGIEEKNTEKIINEMHLENRSYSMSRAKESREIGLEFIEKAKNI